MLVSESRWREASLLLKVLVRAGADLRRLRPFTSLAHLSPATVPLTAVEVFLMTGETVLAAELMRTWDYLAAEPWLEAGGTDRGLLTRFLIRCFI